MPPGRGAGGALWACLLLLALGGACAQALPPVGGGVVVEGAARTAYVGSSGELQAALSPKILPRIDSVVVVNDITLDALSFVPTLAVAKNLSVCGAGGGVVLRAREQVKMANVGGALTLCNLTLVLAFRAPRLAAVHDMMLATRPGGLVRFVDVEFRLEAQTLGWVASGLRHRGVRLPRVDVLRVSHAKVGAEQFTNATFFRDDSAKMKPIDPVAMDHDLGQLDRLTLAAARGDDPLEFAFWGNYTVGQCVLEEVNGGKPYRVARPVTFRGPGGGAAPWMVFGPRLGARGFLEVEAQLRVVDMNVDQVARREHLREGDDCAGGGCGRREAVGDDITSSKGVFVFDGQAPGCRVVMKNAVTVCGCEFLVRAHSLSKREAVHGASLGGAGEFVEVVEMRYIDNSTAHFERFMGGGVCFQNVTATCRPVAVENASLVPCMEEEVVLPQAMGPSERAFFPPSPSVQPSVLDSPSPVGLPEATETIEETRESGETVPSTVYAALVAVGAATVVAVALLIVWWSVVAYARCSSGSSKCTRSPWPGHGSRSRGSGHRSRSRGSMVAGVLPRRAQGEVFQGEDLEDDVCILDSTMARSEAIVPEICAVDG
eukprot:evm.model.scf_2049.2 EVM.evm.TU.scf_2049.2   scf_2049:6281-8086(+)